VTYPLAGDPSMALFGVFDGHGSNGEKVSEFAMWKVQEVLCSDKERLVNEPEKALIAAFEEADRALGPAGVHARVSGTTAVCVLLRGTTMWVANCGDSRAVLAMQDGPASALRIVPLSEDHKPDLPAEEARILGCGGYVSHASPQYGPPRVWVRQGEGPGLAMGRSIGDHVCASVGVIATPEVKRFELEPGCESRILLASDGVWEFIDNEDAMAVVWKHGKSSDACVSLIDESARRWRTAEGNYRDDITAIVAHLPFFDADGASALGESESLRVQPPAPSTPRSSAEAGEAQPAADGGADDLAAGMNADGGARPQFMQRRLTLQGDIMEEGSVAAAALQLQQGDGA